MLTKNRSRSKVEATTPPVCNKGRKKDFFLFFFVKKKVFEENCERRQNADAAEKTQKDDCLKNRMEMKK